jgi:hypothetical protein
MVMALAVAAGAGTIVALVHDTSSTTARTPSPAVTPSAIRSLLVGKPPLPPHQVLHVGWLDTAYDGHPPPFPGTVADPRVPWCRADQLRLTAQGQGATGNLFGGVTARNTSTETCALQGQPSIVVLDSAGKALVRADADPFYVDAWVRLQPGQRAISGFEWYQEFCNLPRPHTLQLTLPHSGGVLRAPMQGAPRCNDDTDPPTAGQLEVHGFARRTSHSVAGRYTPEANLIAHIGHVHRHVLAGNVLYYRVRLESIGPGQVQLRPCLPYRELLVDTNGDVVTEQAFLLNCFAGFPQPDTPQSGFVNYYAMQLRLPGSVPPGTYALRWESVLEPVHDTASGRIVVSAPAPPCTQQQLRITAGRQGAGLGHFYSPVIFRNISTTTCSLRGYPGVEYVAPDGTAIPTQPDHETTIPVRTVVVRPGKAASAMLSGVDFGPNGGATPCPDVSGVRVIARGLTTQVFVPAGVDDCYDGSIFVSAVQPGPRPSP